MAVFILRSKVRQIPSCPVSKFLTVTSRAPSLSQHALGERENPCGRKHIVVWENLISASGPVGARLGIERYEDLDGVKDTAIVAGHLDLHADGAG